ncbi:BTB/POZ and MATH domain-containing protein 1-like [Panicum hallii]|uniref:BTB/POZ and MATH domain-containing protein 1-like n=1 Tax=Panicum hallii TaxID=206008 RepID=UPI000DF4D6DE|nr:BTB/POZ and MATH domain-containing protein 1-like [Panicum hallii]
MVSLSASRSSFGYERFMRREDLEQSGHLIDDCFALRVDVHAVVMEAPSIIVVPPSDMHRHIGDLLSSEGPAADLEFRVGRDTFPAHRLVLSARSPVFRAELLDPAKDGTSVIHIEDMEAPVFRTSTALKG